MLKWIFLLLLYHKIINVTIIYIYLLNKQGQVDAGVWARGHLDVKKKKNNINDAI